MADPLILGVDFSSAPRRAKPITIAAARLAGGRLQVHALESAASLEAFEAFLARPGPWVGGFDFPFGLPRELLEHLGWPHAPAGGEGGWARMVRHLAAMPRPQMVAAFRGWCDARPAGSKFAHRAADLRAGSSPSMKWVNPPVAFMLQAGAPRLLAAGVSVPGMHAGDPARVALEAYPGVLARSVLGRVSYKSDTRAGRTPERAQARRRLLDALQAGALLGLAVELPAALAAACEDDPRGDLLDAVLCAVQAAWACARSDANYGLPADLDPVEGWIAGV
ncbi:MAG: DUF429 domain-containing protein [Gammaproteobacteria bacterium]|jgi:hypothetical protein